MLPSAFLSARSLGRLNVAAVGITLAACTAALFDFAHFASGWAVGVPTLILGTLWARLLRSPATVAGTSLRWGWLASIPLAALNAGLACAAMFVTSDHENVFAGALGGLVAGATLGIFIWAPALVATLVCFGVPIAWSERLAARGLAGSERGERIVGIACAVLGIGALVVAMAAEPPPVADFDPFLGAAAVTTSGHFFALALAIVGAILGLSASSIAASREQRRAAFVARVAAGAVPRFRVEPTPEGQVLIRVESRGVGAYRVADYEEELCRLDAEGHAIAPLPSLRAG